MKNLITTLIITIATLTAALANITPEATIITGEDVTVTSSVVNFFETASFNADSETLDFTTISDISVIQIFDNEGNLEFQLPVMSNKVQLNKNLFTDGEQKLGFIMNGFSQVHLTSVTISK